MSTPGAPPSDERKIATILFADIVGSTELASEEDPERFRVLLDRFYDAMGAEIEQSGGTVEKFVGDAVMATFGAPAALEDHPERALHAALAMQRRVRELFGDGLRLRIGVNTGEVVVGRSREGSSFVSGDPVNVAARLEQAAGAGEVLVGERTAAAVRGAFEFDEPATVEAKGKRGGVEARRLVRALTLMRPRGVSGLKRAFVGREQELALLQATYNRVVAEGRPHLVTVMGDPGVGKTRLVRELWERLGSESPEPLRRTGRCLPYGRGITYWALGEIVKEQLGLLESDPAEAALPKLGNHEILGLALGLDVGGDLHPRAAHDRLHDAAAGFLEELASERPLVLLIEDLHWAEDPLLDLVEHLLREVRAPLLILATARLELLDRRQSWGGGQRNTTSLGLEPLSADDAGRLLDELLAADLPAGVRDLVVSHAEGNPFFVEELVGSLIDAGVLLRENGSWRAGELPAGYAVPDSVQAVLAARIDLLDEVEKGALQAAAVIGRTFWPGPVRDLLAGGEPDFEALEERDFIRRRAGTSLAGEREFAFKHALTREVAYATLPKARRARLHAAFAGWLERVGEGRDEWAALLAHHFAEAARPEDADLAWAGAEDELEQVRDKAVHWLRRAADLAGDRYETDESLALLRRALDVTSSVETAAAIWLAIGNASALKYDGEGFSTAMQRALELSNDPAIIAKTYSDLAFQTGIRVGMWKQRPDPETVDTWIEQALVLTEEGTPERARAVIAQANVHPENPQHARDASALADQLNDPELRSWAWMARAVAAFQTMQFAESLNWAQRRFDLEGLITDPDHIVEMRETAMPPAAAVGRLREARRLADEHTKRTERLSPHHRMHSVALRAEVEELAGNWDGILALQDEIEHAVDANRDTPCVRNARCLLLCAVARAQEGEETAARALEEAASGVGMKGHAYALEAPRIRLTLARGDRRSLAPLLDRDPSQRFVFDLMTFAARFDAIAASRNAGGAEEEAVRFLQPGTYLEPFALRALGAVRGDEALLARALERFQALKLDWHGAQTDALLSG
ncbi:MAG TPA: adenylate/guanylate cyclase domain-containing protein [Gaiellaceae bacterium]|jgi:class 3 adenylate cyclase|nr:adenylate/guanylate cyclase domain-containing protein [Gaiellaceae bacterium]